MKNETSMLVSKIGKGHRNTVDYNWYSFDENSPFVFVYTQQRKTQKAPKSLVSTDISDFLPVKIDNNHITRECSIIMYNNGFEGVIYSTYQNRWEGLDQLAVLLYL